ncbi:MAG: lytic transglycosylase domain-containing protein [Candidatus Saccharibacteria bacterium]|nr:lytic transglycosylase domain-containing protein [Candidatus Saccharibacteria bacterium]
MPIPVDVPFDFDALHKQCAPFVARATMKSFIKHESSFSPFAIGINGGARLERQPQSKKEAIATANFLIEKGYNADFGYGQINSKNVQRLNLDLNDIFDPCKNLHIAATIFLDNYNLALKSYKNPNDATLAAISAYNTGNFSNGFKNGYVKKIAYTALRYQKEELPIEPNVQLSSNPAKIVQAQNNSYRPTVPKLEVQDKQFQHERRVSTEQSHL